MIEIGQLIGLGLFGAMAFGLWKARNASVDDVADMRSVPLVRIVDAKDEQMVRVAGRVAADHGELLIAPVSGRKCVAWQLHFTAPSLGGERILHRDSKTIFLIDDGSCRARVAGSFQVWALAVRAEGAGAPEDVPPSLEAWLEENHSSDEWRSMRRLRWTETRVEPGDQIAVVGIAHVGIDADGDAETYRDAPKSVTIDDSDDAPLSIGDDPSLR